jgi:hypothetical protein
LTVKYFNMEGFNLTEQNNVITAHANGQPTEKKMKENKSLMPYWNMKQEWGREMHTVQWNSKERSGLA